MLKTAKKAKAGQTDRQTDRRTDEVTYRVALHATKNALVHCTLGVGMVAPSKSSVCLLTINPCSLNVHIILLLDIGILL